MIAGSADAARFMDLSFSSSGEHDEALSPLHQPLLRRRPTKTFTVTMFASSIFRSLFPTLRSFLTRPACHWPVVPATAPFKPIPSLRRDVIGTFFGRKRGRVSFAMQTDPRSEPVLLLELATPMHQVVKEMASGMVRILLECDRTIASTNTAATATARSKKKEGKISPRRSLWEEPVWSMYCNGQQRGYAVSRRCNGADLHVLKAVQAVSVGAGVLPTPPSAPSLPPPHPPEPGNGSGRNDGGGVGGANCEVMYMRAKFERVVGNVDSETFYMISPDGGGRGGGDFNDGGPELSIFLLRL